MGIVIISRIDGRHRGGVRHPLGAASYPIGTFTLAQLHDIASDPTIAVVRGTLITHDELPMLLAEAEEVQPPEQAPAGEDAEEVQPPEQAPAREDAEEVQPPEQAPAGEDAEEVQAPEHARAGEAAEEVPPRKRGRFAKPAEG